MPSEPLVKPLPLARRRVFFLLLAGFFFVSLPLFIFYAAGYRYNPFDEVPMLTATGGIYVVSTIDDVGVYVNEVLVTDARTFFGNATYLQGLPAGTHRVHVQAPETHTWVKEIQVVPHIVSEVRAFNLPLRPQVRVVAPFTLGDAAVVRTSSSTTVPFAFASTTNLVLATTSRATSTLATNSEFTRVATLFAEKASTSALRLRLKDEMAALLQQPGPLASSSATTTILWHRATTTVIQNDLMLYQSGDDVYVRALGSGREVPAYFCGVASSTLATTTATGAGAPTSTAASGTPVTFQFAPGDFGYQCRTDIRIDRKWQTVHDFMFMPSDAHLVLMHLDDGLHVVEIDDRSWQNTQLLYPGRDLAVVIDGGRIYASSTEGVVEVLTEIPEL